MDYVTLTVADFNIANSIVAPAAWKLTLQQNVAVLQTPFYYFPLFFYPVKLGDIQSYLNHQDEEDSYSVESYYYGNAINGNTYSDLYIIDHVTAPNLTTGMHLDRYYISDSIGIVKMSLNHPGNSVNVVWELQRCKVIK
jgi:hypothetical protein